MSKNEYVKYENGSLMKAEECEEPPKGYATRTEGDGKMKMTFENSFGEEKEAYFRKADFSFTVPKERMEKIKESAERVSASIAHSPAGRDIEEALEEADIDADEIADELRSETHNPDFLKEGTMMVNMRE